MKIGVTDDISHRDMALFSKARVNKNRNRVEWFYCRKHGHTTLNCKNCAKYLLNVKLKEYDKIATFEDFPEYNLQYFSDCDNGDEFCAHPLRLF